MKLCTTTADVEEYTGSWKESVEALGNTDFKYLDFCFFNERAADCCLLSNHWKDSLKEAKEAADKLGIKFVQAHSPQHNFDPKDVSLAGQMLIEGQLRAIEACSILGVKNIVVHACKNEFYRYPGSKKEYNELCSKFYSKLVPAMEKYNVNVLIENSSEGLMSGKYYFMTGKEIKEFIQEFNHPLLHCCWDIGHANMRGVDQYQDIIDLGDDLRAVHIQDNFGFKDVHVAPFVGTVNMDSVMTALLKLGHLEYFTFESTNLISKYNPQAFIPRHKTLDWIEPKLSSPNLELKIAAEKFLYQIGKYILTQYNCYEC